MKKTTEATSCWCFAETNCIRKDIGLCKVLKKYHGKKYTIDNESISILRSSFCQQRVPIQKCRRGLVWFLLRRSQVHRAELFLYRTHLTRNVRNNRHLFTRPLVKYSVRSPGFDSHLKSGRVRINQWVGCETSVGTKRLDT